MEQLSFKLDQFEGPLDLLLYLISKHKLNILDIEISQLLKQYLVFIDSLTREDMETASQFLEMASRLVYMKTISLLPRHEEEKERLRQELTGQLLEYQLCKAVAALLGESYQGDVLFVKPPEPVSAADLIEDGSQSPQKLMQAYLAAIGKAGRKLPVSPERFAPIVSTRIVPVSARIAFVMNRLYRSRSVTTDELFGESGDRSELVATFLALLELLKMGRIQIDGEDRVQLRTIDREDTKLAT